MSMTGGMGRFSPPHDLAVGEPPPDFAPRPPPSAHGASNDENKNDRSADEADEAFDRHADRRDREELVAGDVQAGLVLMI
jgi:hypothetical protein